MSGKNIPDSLEQNDTNSGIFNNIETLNNLFSIILVAIFVAIFEIILYYFIIVPNLNNSITNGINKLSQVLIDNNINIININYIIDNILTQIFDNDKILSEFNIKNEIKKVWLCIKNDPA